MEEEEGNDYEDVHEAVINVDEIVEHYSHPQVLDKAGLLLKEFKFNTPEVNHAICRLLHRIAFQLNRPAMCYSVGSVGSKFTKSDKYPTGFLYDSEKIRAYISTLIPYSVKSFFGFKATLFRTFQLVNEEKLEIKTNPVIREIWKLGKFIIGKFFENLAKNPKLPIELLLWTGANEWKGIQEGDYANNFIKVSFTI